jgi:hypothetical protein
MSSNLDYSNSYIENTNNYVVSKIEKEEKVEWNLIFNKNIEDENRYIQELFQNLQEIENRDQNLMELTKLKGSNKNLAIYIFYSSSTMTIL